MYLYCISVYLCQINGPLATPATDATHACTLVGRTKIGQESPEHAARFGPRTKSGKLFSVSKMFLS